MGLSFLAPVFLAGLAALAVPIFIHLTQRERKEAIAFPSLMFLRKIPYRTVRRQRIRHWILFLMRCGAIVLLVAAFSRPLLDRDTGGATGLTRARELVVLVDQSYSMAHGERWERGLEAAHDAVDGLGPGNRATLVFFSDRAEARNRATADRAILHAAIDRARIGSGTTRYGPALQLAQRILEESDLPQREVVLITDYQKVGWESQEGVRLPEGTLLTPVDLSGPDASNVAVTDVFLERGSRFGREMVSVFARLANKGQSPSPRLRVRLELNGQEVQATSVTLEPNSSSTVQFQSLPIPQRLSRGTVRAGGDPLSEDNEFHFVITPGDAVSVLLLEHPNARADQSLYLRRALAIGNRPVFHVERKRLPRFGPADLDGRDVVMLNDAPVPSGAPGRALRTFVSDGGGLLVVLGPRSSASGSPVEAGGLLPASLGTPVDRSADRGGTLSFLDYSHPVFELFSTPRTGDFSAARFFRYRAVQATGAATVLARFDDGALALAETRPGTGRVLMWASTLDSFWNDLAVQPVFLPFVHQLLKHLAGYVERESWFTVGQVVDLSGRAEVMTSTAPQAEIGDEEAMEWVVTTPSGERSLLRLSGESHLLELREPGFYELRHVEGQAPITVLAANLDRVESDLSSFDPQELAGAVAPRGEGEGVLAGARALTREELERRQGLWWFLLAGAMLILLSETTVSNRLSRLSR